MVTHYTFMRGGIRDLLLSVKLWRYWLFKSYLSFRLSVSGTKLGFLWPNLSLILVVAVLGTIWGVVLKNSLGIHYYLFLLCGYPFWQLISSTVNKSAKGFSQMGADGALPISYVLFEKIANSAMSLIVVTPLLFFGVFFISQNAFSHLVFFPLALISIFCWCVGISLITAVTVTLLPDIRHLISALMRLSFLATPIIWEPTRLGSYMDFLWFNPFFAPLEMIRYSLSGILYLESVRWVAPIYSMLVLVVGVLAFVFGFNKVRYRAAA